MEITQELLKSLISDQGLSYSQVAKMTGKNVGTISTLAKKFEIISGHMNKAVEKPLPIIDIYNKYISGISLDALHKEYSAPIARIKRQLLKNYPDIIFRTMNDAKRPPDLNDPVKLKEFADKNLTCREISRILDVKEQTVYDAYDRLNVKRYINEYKPIILKPELEDLYSVQKLTIEKISEIKNCSMSLIYGLLVEHGIKIRSTHVKRDSKINELNDRVWLYNEYIINNRSASSIADELNVYVANVVYFLKRNSIELRTKEEMLAKLDGHGHKKIIDSKFGRIECDSILETAFIENMSKDENVKSLEKNPVIYKYLGVCANIDFMINGDTLVEAKSKSESTVPGPNRSRLIKQILVAKKHNRDIKVWNGKFYDLAIEDIDKYYCLNWKLLFNTSDECFDFLIKFGFIHPECSRHKLLKGLSRYEEIIKSDKDLFNSNIEAEPLLSLIKNFSKHFYYSTHHKYNYIAQAWEPGNISVLRKAVEYLWEKDKDVNIHNLVKLINRKFKDFTTVSIFKPWIAHKIYELYLPNGGTVIDPSMGWGGRLIGCMNKNIKYIGYDLNKNVIESHNELKKFINFSLGKCECEFIQADSSTVDFKQGDLLFTSPPYDGTELYHGVDSKNTVTEPIYNNIFSKFSGIIVLNIPLRHEELCKSIGEKFGYKLINKHEMKTASFMGRDKTYEPILVFKKLSI